MESRGGGRSGLIKKRVQVQGEHGTYTSVRWVKPEGGDQPIPSSPVLRKKRGSKIAKLIAAGVVVGGAAIAGRVAVSRAIEAHEQKNQEEAQRVKNITKRSLQLAVVGLTGVSTLKNYLNSRIVDYPLKISEEAKSKGSQAVLAEIENQIKDKNAEVGVAINSKTGEILFSRGGNNKSAVRLSEEDMQKLRDSEDVIFTHNHPGGRSFSLTDLTSASKYNLAEMRAVSGNYTYSVKPGKDGWDELNNYSDPDKLHRKFVVWHLQRATATVNLKNPKEVDEAEIEISHQAIADFSNEFGLNYTRTETRKDSLFAPENPAPVVPNYKRDLAKLMTVFINRVYTDKITRIISIGVVGPNLLINGTAQDEDRLIDFWFDLPNQKLWYKNSDRRLDSYLEAFKERLDKGAKRSYGIKKRHCTNGLNCGGTCIDPDEVCRVGQVAKTIATPKEVQIIEAIAKKVAPQEAEQKDDLEGKSIRQLRAIASANGVVKYSRMNTGELRQAIRSTRLNPATQENIRKTLKNKSEALKVVKEATPQALAQAWQKLQKITKLANVSPETAALLTASFLATTTIATVRRMRDNYKAGLDESANMAIQRAQGIPVTRTGKPNLMFAVGGFSGIGSTGQRMKDILESGGDGTAGDKWLGKANEIIPFNHREFDIPSPSVSKRNPDGSYNPAYLGYVAKQGFGEFVKTFWRGRSEAAVDLAATMYAHGARYKNAPINLLGHGVGGNVAREAVEILHRMRSPDGEGPSGLDIAKRLNIVNMGTPYFGFTNDKIWNTIRNRTITSQGDPFSILPKKAAQWISTVKGAEVDDYLKVPEVRERLREAFGYYTSSIRGSLLQQKQAKDRFGAVGEALEIAGFGAGAKLWKSMGRAVDLAKEKPLEASLLASAAVYHGSKLGYSAATKRYQSNLGESALQAERISDEEINVPNTQKPNHLVVVGGSGADSDRLIQRIREGGDTDENLKWISDRHQIDGFDPAEIPQLGNEALSNNPGGILNSIYGSTLGKVLNVGKSNDAIRLAATLHAYGSKEHSVGGKTGNRKIPINVLAGGNGGNVSREAIDILKRMKGGKEIADRLQLVTTGTPSFFGLASDDMREAQLIGDGDPIANLPMFQRSGGKARRASGVTGHDPMSYLASKDANRQIADAFKSNQTKRPKTEGTAKSAAPTWQVEALASDRPDNPLRNPAWNTLPPEEKRRLQKQFIEKVRAERKVTASQELRDRRLRQRSRKQKPKPVNNAPNGGTP